ncbi:hypothetical protein [Methanothrix soehngenii]
MRIGPLTAGAAVHLINLLPSGVAGENVDYAANCCRKMPFYTS